MSANFIASQTDERLSPVTLLGETGDSAVRTERAICNAKKKCFAFCCWLDTNRVVSLTMGEVTTNESCKRVQSTNQFSAEKEKQMTKKMQISQTFTWWLAFSAVLSYKAILPIAISKRVPIRSLKVKKIIPQRKPAARPVAPSDGHFWNWVSRRPIWPIHRVGRLLVSEKADGRSRQSGKMETKMLKCWTPKKKFPHHFHDVTSWWKIKPNLFRCK